MKILIHGKNLELTGTLKKYTESKISKAIHHYKDIVKEADIHLSVEKNRRVSYQSAEVTVFANGLVIRAEEKSENLYSSIDLVSNKLCRQLRKFKEKKNNLTHNHFNYKNSIKQNTKLINENLIDNLIEEGKEAHLPSPSIKNKYFKMDPISLDDARKQLDIIDHNFYLFCNKKNNQFQVLYKRHNGGYGLIQPK